MTQDEGNAESGEYQPTLTDTLYSALGLPEGEGRAMLMRILFEELITTLVQHKVLSGEELGAILNRTEERISVWSNRSKQDIYKGLEEKGHPQSYVESHVDEIVGRSAQSAEKTLSSIRERLINKRDQ